jgi:fatty acid desaturase
MLVSYTHYKSYHFHHHVAVGSDDDEEIVDYSVESFRNLAKLILRAWNVTRLPHFLAVLIGMFRGHYPPRIKKIHQGQLFHEYILLSSVFVIAICSGIFFNSITPIVLWFAPWLLVAEPVHFMIEVPEHLGCDRKTRSILRNTRSYRTNFLWGYFSNHNNYHIEHHLWPGVPSHRLRHLHRDVVEANGHCSAGFWQALGEVSQATRPSPAEGVDRTARPGA